MVEFFCGEKLSWYTDVKYVGRDERIDVDYGQNVRMCTVYSAGLFVCVEQRELLGSVMYLYGGWKMRRTLGVVLGMTFVERAAVRVVVWAGSISCML